MRIRPGIRIWLTSILCFGLVQLSMTGCTIKCDADADNDIEDAIDDIGDEIEESVDDVKDSLDD